MRAVQGGSRNQSSSTNRAADTDRKVLTMDREFIDAKPSA
jgi:hypothetical protein